MNRVISGSQAASQVSSVRFKTPGLVNGKCACQEADLHGVTSGEGEAPWIMIVIEIEVSRVTTGVGAT